MFLLRFVFEIMNLLAAILLASISVVTAYKRSDVLPGPYCGKRLELGGGCCYPPKPMQHCAHDVYILNIPMQGSECYCHSQCNVTNDYCCPDYEEVCPPPSEIIPKFCQMGPQKMIQCNKCTCKDVNDTINWSCEQDVCMISDDVVNAVNNDSCVSWTAASYKDYNNKKLAEGLKYRLGTLPVGATIRYVDTMTYNINITYPWEFDARQHWPGFISRIQDQGWCGSDWAVSTASVLSDRFVIKSNGAEAVGLSSQTLLSCNRNKQQGCDGGHVDSAWKFVRKCGLVDEDCYPYQGTGVECPFKKSANLLQSGCPARDPKRTSRYKSGRTYRLVGEKDIMYEIMNNGPVQAVMTVYQDFFHYRDGVYRHTRHGDQVMKGLHSVKIVGWGEMAADQYWIVANSWGEAWGENGYFRIARGTNESGIESLVLFATSEVIQVTPRSN